MRLRLLVYGLLAVACSAQAQPLQDFEAGPAASPCRIREAAARESWGFLWSGPCVNGYAQGEGTLQVWQPHAVTIERGQFGIGRRQGLWETYSRATRGDGEITNYLTEYRDGTEIKDAKSFGGARGVKPRDVPGWAERLTRSNYADALPARAAPAPATPAAPAAAAPAAAAAAAPAAEAAPPLPALSPRYKGHLYVVRVEISDAKGTAGDFMSYVAPDRASAQRLYDEYASGRNSLAPEAKPALLGIDECDGRGAGPYFALAVLHEARDGLGGGGGWVCGAPSADAAARAALEACKTASGAQCRPRPEAHLYLLVSTHAAVGSTRVREMGTFSTATRVWSNYDYAGCLWAGGAVDAQGGVNCRSYFTARPGP